MRKRVLLVFLLSLVFVSCNKWKKPADVKFHADINKAAAIDGQLTFSGGYIVLDYFYFDGEREKGDDVYFENEFTSGLTIPFDETQSIQELEYMIPQGEYKRIDIRFRTLDDDNTVSLVVTGTYAYSGGGTIPVKFEFMESEQFDIRAEDDGGGNIILNKDIMSPAKIVLDPKYWFDIVPESYFENASITSVEGVNTLVINDSENENIYEMILDRLDETALVIFNY